MYRAFVVLYHILLNKTMSVATIGRSSSPPTLSAFVLNQSSFLYLPTKLFDRLNIQMCERKSLNNCVPIMFYVLHLQFFVCLHVCSSAPVCKF